MAANLWLIYALAAAVLWGFAYSLYGQLLGKTLSPSALLVFSQSVSLPVYIGIALRRGTLRDAVQALQQNPERLGFLFAAIVAIVMANFFIMTSIAAKNATVSSLVEISYPLFTVLFAYLLFGEKQLNAGLILGACLIFAGIAIIGIAGRSNAN